MCIILAIIVIVVFFVIGFTLLEESEYLFGYDAERGRVGGLIFVIIAAIILIFVVSVAIFGNRTRISTLDSEVEIVSVDRGSETEGSFAIFSGSVDDVAYYYVMTVYEDGYILKKFNAEKTKIVETDDAPHVETYYTETEGPVYDFLFMWNFTESVIYVPVGTVIEQYNVN